MIRPLLPILLAFSLIFITVSPAAGQTCTSGCGDANSDGSLDISDIVFLVSYFFSSGTAPTLCANVNGCGGVTTADFIRYLWIDWESPIHPVFGDCEVTSPCSTLVGGQVRLGCPPYQLYPGENAVAVPVYITTVPGVRGATLGFRCLSDSVIVSDIDKSGSHWASSIILGKCQPTEKKVLIVADLSPAASGQAEYLLCKLKVQILGSEPQRQIVFDTAYVAPGGEWLLVTDQPPYYRPTLSQTCCNMCGDANNDGAIDVSDAIALIECIFFECTQIEDCVYTRGKGDANGDQTVDISDAVYLIAYIFSGGSCPHCYGLPCPER